MRTTVSGAPRLLFSQFKSVALLCAPFVVTPCFCHALGLALVHVCVRIPNLLSPVMLHLAPTLRANHHPCRAAASNTGDEEEVLVLNGTVPIAFRGARYEIPVEVRQISRWCFVLRSMCTHLPTCYACEFAIVTNTRIICWPCQPTIRL